MISYFCSPCLINWWPYMCSDGRCPRCGSGTRREQEPASPEALELHAALVRDQVERERSAHNHKLFEEYYAAREAARQPTVPIDSLEVLAQLSGDDNARRRAA